MYKGTMTKWPVQKLTQGTTQNSYNIMTQQTFRQNIKKTRLTSSALFMHILPIYMGKLLQMIYIFSSRQEIPSERVIYYNITGKMFACSVMLLILDYCISYRGH